MAVNDFTGKNIQDTYQRVVQTDGTNLADGTGSLLPISFDGNNVIISGSLTATEYSVTSSVTNIVIATLSGSTVFGNSSDDIHKFIGHITASGNISASGTIVANKIESDNLFSHVGDANTGIQLGSDTVVIEGNDISIGKFSTSRVELNKPVTASGDISSSGVITGEGLFISDDATITDDFFVGGNSQFGQTIPNLGQTSTVDVYGDLNIQSHITASGNISASGTIDAEGSVNVHGNDGQLNLYGGLEIHTSLHGRGNINSFINKGGNNLGIGVITPTEILQVEGNISASGFISTEGHITASGNISASGTIDAEGSVNVHGNDGQLNLYGGLEIHTSLHGRGNINSFINKGGNNLGIGVITPTEILQVEGNISASGNIIGVTGSFDYVKTDRLQVGAAGGTDVLSIDGGDLQLENGKQITFSDIGDGNTGRVRIVGNEDNDFIQMHVDNSNSHVLALTTTGVGVGTTSPGEKLEVVGNISSSGDLTTRTITADGNITSTDGNIKANYIETAKIPLIQYISTETTSIAQGRILAASSHNNATDSFALEWDTPLFEDTDFFETGSVSPTTSGTINTFAVKQTGRYEINCNITFKGTSGARPGINLGIFTSSNAASTGSFRPAGPAAHAYVRLSSPANGSTAAIPGFVIQLSSGSAISMKVDLKDDFGATGNTFWSGSLSHFNMKKIG